MSVDDNPTTPARTNTGTDSPAKAAAPEPASAPDPTSTIASRKRSRGKRSPSEAANGATSAAGNRRTRPAIPTADAPPCSNAKTPSATKCAHSAATAAPHASSTRLTFSFRTAAVRAESTRPRRPTRRLNPFARLRTRRLPVPSLEFPPPPPSRLARQAIARSRRRAILSRRWRGTAQSPFPSPVESFKKSDRPDRGGRARARWRRRQATSLTTLCDGPRAPTRIVTVNEVCRFTRTRARTAELSVAFSLCRHEWRNRPDAQR